MAKEAKFNLGDQVIHIHLGYRALVVDADPLFQASTRYNPQACKRSFAQRNPWYRLLVDGSSQMTYVEECMLKPDFSGIAIDNPNIAQYFKEQQGSYYSNFLRH